jgi:glycerate dehydrogenase
MNIVVLDGHALNPGDLSWSQLSALGEIQVYDHTDADQVVDRAKNAEIVLTNKSLLLQAQLDHLPNLRFISVMATGYNIVDIQKAKHLGIQVSNVRGYSSDSVAQHTMALILELSNHVGLHANDVFNGGWNHTVGWSYWKKPLVELSGKNLGIIGFGNIGKKTAQMARAFGMNILVYHPKLKESTADYSLVSLDSLFDSSDIISLHVPLTDQTKHLVNKDRLQQMKPTSLIVNTSRGPLINEDDLKWALQQQEISGAGLDVLSSEPPIANHPLIGVENCIITPHQAWASLESRRRLMQESVANVEAYLKGEPRNLVT